MEATITLRECLDFMDSGLIFSFKCAQYDENRKKGWGKWQQYGEAKLLQHDDEGKAALTEKPTFDGNPVIQTKLHVTRKPNHFRHMTRNLRICIGKRPINKIVKIHLDLMVRFNGRQVILP
jgi:hypothetical protein